MLTNTAPVVVPTRLAQAAPTPAGGTIVAGTYYLTADVFYSGPGGSTIPPGGSLQVTSTIGPGTNAGEFAYEDASSTNGGAIVHSSIILVPSGTSVTARHLCPDVFAQGGLSYTATADTLLLFSTVLGTVETYARQP